MADERRVFADITLEALADRIAGLTSAQTSAILRSYEGKWAQTEANVVDVTDGRSDDYISIKVKDQWAWLHFDKGEGHTLGLNKGDLIIAQGVISASHSPDITLVSCEIISRKSAIELAKNRILEQTRDANKAFGELKEALNEVPAAYTQSESCSPAPQLGERSTDKPRLPDAALKLWHQAFLKAYPTGSQTLALKSAEGAFPNHRVARSRVRELFPDAKRGRPKQINDLENSPESDGE